MKFTLLYAQKLSHMVLNGKNSAVAWNNDLVDQIIYQMM